MNVLRGGVLTRIHVNRHVIAANKKSGDRLAVFTIKHRGRTIYAHEVEMSGRLVYRPDKPLSCGAQAWIETREDVRYVPA